MRYLFLAQNKPYAVSLQVQGTCEYAIRCWWEDAHPGWMIFTLGNQHFETLDEIIKASSCTLLFWQASVLYSFKS